MSKVFLVSLFGDVTMTHSRISNIYNYSSDLSVHVITSDFDHGRKKYKEVVNNIEYSLFHVPSYKKNLSLKRIYSHIVFAYKLKKFFGLLREVPSVVYCAMPTSTAAYICGRYCKKHGIKFVIDVIDLWPDSLFPIVGGIKGKILKCFVFPWKYITIQSYKMANVILGESERYAQEAARYNDKASVYPLYLGVDREEVNQLIAESKLFLDKPNDEIWIGYGGSLGTSYDFKSLIEGVAALNGQYQYKLWFIGDGVCRAEIKKLVDKYFVNAEITGFLEYKDLLKYLSYCDIAVNIFRDNTKVVHSYKFNDYVATNCFVLNSLPGETANMIDQYKIGLNFDFRKNTLGKVLLQCFKFWDYYKEWKVNNEKLISEVLDKDMIYPKIKSILDKCSN